MRVILSMRSPFEPWLEGSQPLPSRFYAERVEDFVTDEWSCWVAPAKRVSLHLADTLEWLSLANSRTRTQAYLATAAKVVSGLEGAWLDGWERAQLRESGLIPPSLCYPIYLITCEDEASERIVYVGKTSVSNRFSGGHAAALKLHAPEYANQSKWIYQCDVWFLHRQDYLCLEWLDPVTTAEAVLDGVESQLIFDLQPALNTAKRKKLTTTTPLVIHMQNMVSESRLPQDHFVYPPATSSVTDGGSTNAKT